MKRANGHLTATAGDSLVKRSDIFLAAWVAAEEALPEESRKLIEAHDALHAEWRKAGWPSPIPPQLQAAAKAVESDELARIAFDLRRCSNHEASLDMRASNPPESNEPAVMGGER